MTNTNIWRNKTNNNLVDEQRIEAIDLADDIASTAKVRGRERDEAERRVGELEEELSELKSHSAGGYDDNIYFS